LLNKLQRIADCHGSTFQSCAAHNALCGNFQPMITSGSALLFAQLRLSFYRLNSHAQHISTKISGTAGLSNRSLCKIAPKKTPTRPFTLAIHAYFQDR
jgi:hypothetical protein